MKKLKRKKKRKMNQMQRIAECGNIEYRKKKEAKPMTWENTADWLDTLGTVHMPECVMELSDNWLCYLNTEEADPAAAISIMKQAGLAPWEGKAAAARGAIAERIRGELKTGTQVPFRDMFAAAGYTFTQVCVCEEMVQEYLDVICGREKEMKYLAERGIRAKKEYVPDAVRHAMQNDGYRADDTQIVYSLLSFILIMLLLEEKK